MSVCPSASEVCATFASFGGPGVDDVLHLELGDGCVLFVLHGELTDALRCTSQLGSVAKHGGQWHICVYYEQTSLGLSVCDCASAFDQLTHDAALELDGDGHLDVHDWLQNLWVGILERLAERILGCDLEGHCRGIHDVSLSISEDISAADYGVAGFRAFLGALMEGFLDGRNVLIWHIIAGRSVLKNAAHVSLRIINIVV